MVGSEEVDEQLQEEIEEECSKYGDVENVIIYQVNNMIIFSRKSDSTITNVCSFATFKTFVLLLLGETV